jgi:hypothetical protein
VNKEKRGQRPTYEGSIGGRYFALKEKENAPKKWGMRSTLLFRVALAGVMASQLLGCCGVRTRDAEWQGSPQVQLANARSRPLAPNIRRVLAFPLHVPQIAGTDQRDLDNTFNTELNKHQRFEVVRISRDDLARLIGREEISSTEAFPADALAQLKQRYAADAFLFTDITSYRPYRPMAIGVRSRLLEANTLRELWAVDTTLDAAHHEVQSAATSNGGSDGPHAGLVLQSPRAYATFVAQQTFSTLPPR